MSYVFTSLTTMLVCAVLFVGKMELLTPEPTSNSVLGEKPNMILGGQAVVVIPENLTVNQRVILNEAYSIAKADGHKSPELVQGIILQETLAGALKNWRVAGSSNDPYYGLSQLKIAAAKDVMRAYPLLWAKYSFHTKTDDELKANLILNDLFNIAVASKYLLLLQNRYHLSGLALINAYNRGPGGVQEVDDSFHYAIGVKQKLSQMKKTNEVRS